MLEEITPEGSVVPIYLEEYIPDVIEAIPSEPMEDEELLPIPIF